MGRGKYLCYANPFWLADTGSQYGTRFQVAIHWRRNVTDDDA